MPSAKPYASDLLVALGLLALAIEWFGSPERTGWLWMLVGFAPIALAASYPAVLVAGGIGLALAPTVWRTRRRGPKIALAAYVVVVAATFAVLFFAVMHRQQSGAAMAATPAVLGRFLPPARLARTAGELADHDPRRQHVRLPLGGSRGASSGTLILVLIAAVVLWRRGQQDDPRAPGDADGRGAGGRGAQALSLRRPGADHAVHRPRHLPDGRDGPEHPSGMAPAGDAEPRRSGSRPSHWPSSGSSRSADDLRHPYRAIYDHQAREFARRFWPEQAEGAEVACLQWDFGISSAACRRCAHGDLPVQSADLFPAPATRRRAALEPRDGGTAAPLRGLRRRHHQEPGGDRLARIDEKRHYDLQRPARPGRPDHGPRHEAMG